MEPFDKTKVSPEYCDLKALEFFREKYKTIDYRCSGFKDGNRVYDVITSCSPEEKAALLAIQAEDPDAPLFILLPEYEAEYGFDSLSKDLEGEDGFQIEHIDWTPVHSYQFSYEEAGERHNVPIILDDGEYVDILSYKLQYPDKDFTHFFVRCPRLAGKITGQTYFERGVHPDSTHMFYMDEIEADAKIIMGR